MLSKAYMANKFSSVSDPNCVNLEQYQNKYDIVSIQRHNGLYITFSKDRKQYLVFHTIHAINLRTDETVIL